MRLLGTCRAKQHLILLVSKISLGKRPRTLCPDIFAEELFGHLLKERND
jgi:hypothetical protein